MYAAVEKTGHPRSVEDLEREEDPKEPEADASTAERMRHRMRTQKGRDGERWNGTFLKSQMEFPQNPAAGFCPRTRPFTRTTAVSESFL